MLPHGGRAGINAMISSEFNEARPRPDQIGEGIHRQDKLHTVIHPSSRTITNCHLSLLAETGPELTLRNMISSTPASRLKFARFAAGYRTAKEFSDKHGIPQPTYSNHESGGRSLLPDVAADYATKLGNTSAGWLLTGEGISPTAGTGMPQENEQIAAISAAAGALEEIEVIGAVQAGHWVEAAEWDRDEKYRIIVPVDPRFSRTKKIGLQVNGTSMNRIFPPGSILVVCSLIELGRDPRSGERVIVHRRRPDSLVEVTVKEFVVEGGLRLLFPRSTNPSHQAPLALDDPGPEDQNEDIHLTGLVIDAIPPGGDGTQHKRNELGSL